ncbi:MAG TPA: DUF5916 domain-containing protein [Vicinamibacterales bacterium]|nr:DUF5916 domain-containing protein [Vicinamibacterales bacterium]
MAATAAPAAAQTISRGQSYPITKAKGAIVIDGDLNDEGWRDALRVDKWYEINPGDNIEPAVRNVAYLTYDDHFFYAAFEFDDPNPKLIMAPYADRDTLQQNADYGGIFLDTRNEGHTAYEFQVSARNVQFDAVMDDNGGGENSSPDFFWESATRINDHGWTLEIRVPFSSLRYRKLDPQTWGVMLWRNYARDFRHQFSSARFPRGNQCFVCLENSITGLQNLPTGGHIVVAPYLSGAQTAHPAGDLGTPLTNDPLAHKVGMDMKYIPDAYNTLDATIRPDFSQIESDTAQISTNQRFALFYPEKRPFFLEGVELLATPIQAVYTRTMTAPDWGGRATGKLGGVNYTALVTQDAGGGSVVVPGPNASSLAPQDFASTAFIGRARRDFNGGSFVSMLMTDRESGADGHNRVIGPDFQVRWHGTETVSGQWLFSDTTTPNRPDANAAWTGNTLKSGAAQFNYSHNATHYDFGTTYKDFGTGFRADNGFVPQVGYREDYTETGWTFRPHGFISRMRTFVMLDEQNERDNGALIYRQATPAVGMDTAYNGFLQFRFINDRIRAGDQTFPRQAFFMYASYNPTRRFSNVGGSFQVGQDTDFVNVRAGRGVQLDLNASITATDHLVFDLIDNTTWLNVDNAAGASTPLFTARVERVRANYTFTARSFVRLIGQHVSTDRDPSLYLDPTTTAHDGSFSGSVLFAYKINWQSVMFFGYGDDRTLDDQRRLQKADRSLFVKMSYAFQR